MKEEISVDVSTSDKTSDCRVWCKLINEVTECGDDLVQLAEQTTRNFYILGDEVFFVHTTNKGIWTVDKGTIVAMRFEGIGKIYEISYKYNVYRVEEQDLNFVKDVMVKRVKYLMRK